MSNFKRLLSDSKLDSYLAIVGDVLQLVYDGQLAVPPVVDAGVQLAVQGLEVLQSSSDEPPSVRGCISVLSAAWPALTCVQSCAGRTPGW